MSKRHNPQSKYPYRRQVHASVSPPEATPATSVSSAPPAHDPLADPSPSSDPQTLVATLEADGYTLVTWQRHEKGIRAQQGGKLAIPSEYTKGRVCLAHGNWAKVRHDTALGREDQGFLILDVAPCVFCRKDAAEILLKSPRTESHLSVSSPKSHNPECGQT